MTKIQLVPVALGRSSMQSAALYLAAVLWMTSMLMPGPAWASEQQSAPIEQAVVVPVNEIEPSDVQPSLFLGSDQLIMTVSGGQLVREGEQATLQFDNVPVGEVLQAVLGDLLQLDYIIHPPIGGAISVFSQRPISADQILFVLEAALQANGMAMVHDARGLLHIGSVQALAAIAPPVRLAAENRRLPPGASLLVVPLNHVGVTEMAQILQPVLPSGALVRADSNRNVLLLTGSRTQLEGWLDLVDTFDIDLLSGLSVGLFPLKYATVREVQAALQLLASEAFPQSEPANTDAVTLPEFAQGLWRVLPIERLNALLVVATRRAHLETAQTWIARLDQPAQADSEPQLYVYPVQNGSAAHLAELLAGIFGPNPTGNEEGQGMAASTLAPGLESSQGSGALAIPALGSTTTNSGLTPLRPRVPGQPLELGSQVRVMPDTLGNALVIYAPRSAYRQIEAALRALDRAPTQVLIEASIVEVSLINELRYGLQWFFQDSARRGLIGQGSLNLNASGGIGPIQPGFSYSLTDGLGNVRAVLNALADRSLLQVISSPSLLVLDNHTAVIQVGDQQPIRSGETVTDGGVRSTSIEYKDTGVSLAVTPSVNAGDRVTLQLRQTVTDVGPIDTATQPRSFQQRQVESRIAVLSGESVVLGGLIRDNNSRGRSGLPGVSEVPLVGALFSNTQVNSGRTELVIIVTPRVIRSDADARDVTLEFRERLRGLNGLQQRIGEDLPPILRTLPQ